MVWGSLAALNHWVLGFHAWPDATPAPRAQRLILPDAPAPRPVAATGTRATLVLPAGLIAGGPAVAARGTELAALIENTPRERGRRTQAAVGSPGGVSAPGNGGTTPGAAADADGDGISNAVERRLGSNPDSADTDNDGVPDGWELKHGLNPRDFRDGAADGDGDGVPNKIEFRLKTDPQKLASRDGVPDGSRDSNGDGVTDAVTVQNGGDPTAAPEPAAEPEAPAVVTPEPTPAEPVIPEPTPAEPTPTEPTPPTPPVEEPAPTPATPPDPAPEPSPPAESTPPADPPATDPVPAGDTGTGGGVAAPDEAAVAETVAAP